MFKHSCLLLLLFLITTLTASVAHSTTTNTTEAIATLCQDRSIVLLGEIHQEPDSQVLFLDLIRHYVKRGDRVYVGLEIPSDEQIDLMTLLLVAVISRFSILSYSVTNTMK